MEASLRSSASASLPWAISSNLAHAVLRASAVVNASSRFCRVFLGEPNQSLRLDYLRGSKEIDEKLMCSETPTAGTLPAIYASEAWSCDLNVEELKVKSNPTGPNYMS